MYFDWNTETIRWYVNAETYTGFYKKLAEDIRPLLAGCRTLCDLGCGAALFDFAMAPYMHSIDCADLNETALSSVEDRAAKLGLTNLRTRLADCDTLAGQWDAVFMSFFGSGDPDRYLPLCRKLVAVVAAESADGLFPRRERGFSRNSYKSTAASLDEKGVSYKLTVKTYPFGQPFTSRGDAELFVRTYAAGVSEKEAGAFLDERLARTDSAEFPLYIPRMKTVGIFELEGGLV